MELPVQEVLRSQQQQIAVLLKLLRSSCWDSKNLVEEKRGGSEISNGPLSPESQPSSATPTEKVVEFWNDVRRLDFLKEKKVTYFFTRTGA